MTDTEKARELFQAAGLAFPNIPKELAARLKEKGKWVFSTRKVNKVSPYNLEYYLYEANVHNYVILSHSGHGVNSYAIQYYLVYKALRMFLFLGWGGAYMDAKAAATQIHDCFSLADEIVPTTLNVGKIPGGDRLTIMGSDFYGSYWSRPDENPRKRPDHAKGPAEVLQEVLNWLQSGPG
jgi:hypothetical protein